jgi:hypothetical protein
MAARIAMMAITTNSSIRVKARGVVRRRATRRQARIRLAFRNGIIEGEPYMTSWRGERRLRNDLVT